MRHTAESAVRSYALSGVSSIGESVKHKGDDRGHSGRLLLRMPRGLHADLARVAEKRGISLNQLIVGLLSHSLDNGADVVAQQGPGETATAAARAQRRLSLALAVNLVVLIVAGAIAIALLVAAWRGGF
jgi:hypothetical protein